MAITWPARSIRWILAVLLGLALLAGIIAWTSRHPAIERDWAPDHARQAWADSSGDSITIRNFRSFRYPARAQQIESWTDRTVDLSQLQSVWFVLVPLSAEWRGPAHTFLSFGFADSTFVAISVEARRERAESYSVWQGMLREYELIYVVGDEPDLIGRRLTFDRDPIYVYPIDATPEAARAVFLGMLREGGALRSAPQFYHTLTNNCTTAIVSQANAIHPEGIPGALASLLPGYSDKVARDLGLIDSTMSLEAVRQRYRVEASSGPLPDDPRAFGRLIREGRGATR